MSAPGDLHEVTRFERGPGGALRVVCTWPADHEPDRAVVVLSPSPLLGGDLDNNVTEALAHAAARAGFAALRFDYRNAGKSGGDTGGLPRAEWWHDRAHGDRLEPVLDDVRHVLDGARALFRVDALVGYSFGAVVATHVAHRVPDARIALVCPPLSRHATPALPACAARALIVTAEDDLLDRPLDDAALAERAPGARVLRLAGADHFLIDDTSRAVTPVMAWIGGAA